MSTPQPFQFRNLGDWLIWRATGPLGDFRMPECIRIIQTEGVNDRWLAQVSTPDIQRILARYKEHVHYWNIAIDVIRAELNAFTVALNYGHNYFEIATLFDVSEPRRTPMES